MICPHCQQLNIDNGYNKKFNVPVPPIQILQLKVRRLNVSTFVLNQMVDLITIAQCKYKFHL
jgi:hypothetical protein